MYSQAAEETGQRFGVGIHRLTKEPVEKDDSEKSLTPTRPGKF